MKRRFAAALALALCAAPAAARLRVELKGPPEHSLRGLGGLHAVDSRGRIALVRVISPGSPIERRGTLRILVMNLSDKPFSFGPRNVSLTLADGTRLAVIPYGEFEKGAQLVEREVGRRDSVNARNMANLPALSESGSTGMYGQTLSANSATPNSTASGSQAASRLDRSNKEDRSPAAELRAMVDEVMIRTIVPPNKGGGGYVVFELPKEVRSAKVDQPMTLVVNAGGEQHRFDAVLDRR